MQKALLISILAATIVIPLFASRAKTLKKAVARSVIATAVFCAMYWVGLVFVYPHLPAPTNNTAPR